MGKSRLKNELHPLQNDLVLKKFFELCPLDQLMTFSKVSKKWRSISLIEVRKQAILKVGWRSTSASTSSFFPINDFTMNEASSSWELMFRPFRKCKLQLEDWDWTMATTDILKSRVGVETIRQLEMCKGRIPINIFNDLIFGKMVNLETLKMNETMVYVPRARNIWPRKLKPVLTPPTENHLTIRSFEYHTFIHLTCDMNDVRMFVYEFLRKVPNLEEFVVRYHPDSSSDGPDVMAKVMNLLRKEGRVVSIKKLEMSGKNRYPNELPLESTFIETIPIVFPVLEHLRIDMCPKWQPEDIKNVLQSLSGTLRKLEVHRERHSTKMDTHEHKVFLDFLEELCMLGESYHGLNFLNMVDAPNLKKLTLYKYCHLRLRPYKFESVEVLDLKNIDPLAFIGADQLKWLWRSFPNLKELSLPVRKQGFRFICEHWEKLRVLKIYDSRICHITAEISNALDNEAITGVTSRWSRKPPLPNITMLKDLKEFRMKSSVTNHKETFLTDQSIFRGFLRMPNLQILSIRMEKISKKARKALEKKMITLDTRWLDEEILFVPYHRES